MTVGIEHWSAISRRVVTVTIYGFDHFGFKIFRLVLAYSCSASTAGTRLTLQGLVQESTDQVGVVLVVTAVLGALQELGNVRMTLLGGDARHDVSVHFPARGRLKVQIRNILISGVRLLVLLVVLLRLLDEVLVHIEPFVLKNVWLIVTVGFVVASTVAVISHITLLYLIFHLEFGSLGV